MQICNALTNEVLREKTYRKTDLIFSLLESAEKGQECILFDENFKTYKGNYVSHVIDFEGDMKVYKVFFDLKISDIQARVECNNMAEKWTY